MASSDTPDTTDPVERLRQKKPGAIEAIHELADEKGRPPTTREVTRETEYIYTTITYNSESTWGELIEALGYDYSEVPRGSRAGKDYPRTAEKHIRIVYEVADELGRPPYATEVKEDHQSTYQWLRTREYVDSWEDALQAIGMDVEEPYRIADGRGNREKITEEELLYEIYSGALALGRSPHNQDVVRYSEYAAGTYQNRFGGEKGASTDGLAGWEYVLKDVGLPPAGEPVDELELELRLDYLWSRHQDEIDTDADDGVDGAGDADEVTE